jgi:glycosyltransferase involved in cell wall biosynthesis
MLTTALSREILARFAPSQIPLGHHWHHPLRVFLTMPTWTLHRSTDRTYVYSRFARLAHDWPLQFFANTSARFAGSRAGEHLIGRASALLGVARRESSVVVPLAVPHDVEVAFSYGFYPRDAGRVPVVWEQTFAPAEYGHDEDAWLREMRVLRAEAAERAAFVVTATEASAAWFERAFPDHARKLRVIPYLMTDVESASDALLEAKANETDRIRLLFVGKEARRKGLETFIAAWQLLGRASRQRFDVHVVSSMLDGPVTLPPEWRHSRHVHDVHACMREAHALVFPTRREAYGLVLPEAMAAGCIPITSASPIQRSIVGENVGFFVDPTQPRDLADALERLSAAPDLLGARMHAARDRYQSNFHPATVARAYFGLLTTAAGRVPALA